MKNGIKGLTLAGLVAVGGCATLEVPPEYYAGIVKDLAPKKGLMVVSGCAVRDEVGQDFVITSISDAHTEAWGQSAPPYLASYGLPTSGPAIRMTCAGYVPKAKEKVFFVPTRDAAAEARPGKFPRVVSTEVVLEDQTARNLNALFAEVYAAPVTKMKSKNAPPPRTGLKLAAEQVQQLRTATGADYLWIVATDENEVSAGKAVGTAVLTAVLSMGTYAAMPKGGRSNMVALVDLAGRTTVWKKIDGNAHGAVTTTVTNPGAAAPTYQTADSTSVSTIPTDQLVAARLFEPLLPIGEGLAGRGVAPPAEPVTAPVAETPAQPSAK